MAKLDGLDRVFDLLDEAAPGLHDVEPPAPDLPGNLPEPLPEPLIELYARCDGARIFVDTLEIVPARDVAFVEGRWQFATCHGEPVALDHRGRVWIHDETIEDAVCEATRLDRWLAGELDALALIFDGDGEYAEDVFDDEGEMLAVAREQQLRAKIKRDAAAAGPRWRLALVLLEQGADEDARNQLEQVVADDPGFAWAWLDLARVSEKIGEVGGAIDEARMAAEAAEGVQHPQAGYFWSQVARLAVRAGDEMARAQAATKASLLAPELKQSQIAGARERLAAGDHTSAKGLLELLRAVWPRDLEVLDLAKQLT
ncbi:MAG: tetratricopeptide repeat protein [Kofleriaceae bacterium]